MRLRSLLNRALPFALACCALAPITGHATDYTDMWWVPAESGWGVNVVQADDGTGKPFLWLTFFIQGPDKNPTWYTGQLTWTPTTGKYEGGLYLTKGTYFAQPWNSADKSTTPAGTVTFTPTNAWRGTLVYTVSGLAPVTKTIERQTLTRNAIGASYVGGQSDNNSGCTSSNGTFISSFTLVVSQTTTGGASFAFNYGGGLSCTLTGTLEQHGQIYEIPVASYTCNTTPAFQATAAMKEIKATAQGIEGRWTANLGASCVQETRFSGTFSSAN